MIEQIIQTNHDDQIPKLFGNLDENIKYLEKEYDVCVINRDGFIKVRGLQENVDMSIRALNTMLFLLDSGEALDKQSIYYVFDLVKEGAEHKVEDILKEVVCITNKGKQIKAKTLGQGQYISQMKKRDLVFGIGPAGTGKTYLAVAMAVQSIKNGDVGRIILTRPAVEAGEKLGFLPGDLQEKVDPYLRPLYDALGEFLGPELFEKYLEKNIIEVAPLAYMRGRTLDDAFVILDEAQNTTPEQMKMFLTRLGMNSKSVVTGDITQIDLPNKAQSGLLEAVKVLENVEEISIISLSQKDIVRHALVQKIIDAYEGYYHKIKEI